MSMVAAGVDLAKNILAVLGANANSKAAPV